jgi:Na+(H+)/acetate symporter ActP
MLSTVIIIFLVVAFIAANLPWISERLFGLIEVKSGKKSVWLCLIEWFTLYLRFYLLFIPCFCFTGLYLPL